MREQFEPYRPSNGTECDVFMAEYCERCVHDDPANEDYCEIIAWAMACGIGDDGYPGDTWVYFNGKPTCLAFRERGGDMGGDNTPPDPNQIDLFEELPVLQPA